MLDTWGGDNARPWRRSRVPKHAGRRPGRGRHRKGGCAGIALAVPLGCVLWAAVLVPLILYC